MRAVQFDQHGDKAMLECGESPDTEPGPGEVRFVVRVCASDHPDIWTRRGRPVPDLTMPHVPGSDAAGEWVTRFEPGDQAAVPAGGHRGNCEFCRDGDPTRCVDYHIVGEHSRGVHAESPVVLEDALVPSRRASIGRRRRPPSLVFQTVWRMPVTRGVAPRRVGAWLHDGHTWRGGRRTRTDLDRCEPRVRVTPDE